MRADKRVSVVNELTKSNDNVHIVRVNGPLNGGLKIRLNSPIIS